MKIDSKSAVAGGKWLELVNIAYTDNRGTARVWEAVDRRKCAGAIVVIARMMPSDRLLLVRQFRPPAGKLLLEFPAGLIEPGEDPALAAVRELKEETGYSGTVRRLFGRSFNSPGLSGESLVTAFADVDESAQKDRHTHFDETEDIETFAVPRLELAAFLEKQAAAGVGVDAKLQAFAISRLMD